MVRAPVLTAILPLLVGASLSAQTRIPDEPSCARCTISMRRLAVLGTMDGPGALPGSSIIRQDGAGRFWIIHPPDLPIVFDSTGRVVSAPFRKGQGPNEFGGAAVPIALPGDSTLAIENSSTRATVLTRDLRAARVIQLSTLRINTLQPVRWPDLVVINGTVPSRNERVEPLSTASFAGAAHRVIKTFGGHPNEPLPTRMEIRSHIVPTGSQFWVAAANRYRLALWDTAGTIVRVLERRPSWFAGPSPGVRGPANEPGPYVSAMTMDEQGLLWVFIHVAAPTWREGWPKVPEGVREIRADAIRGDKMYRAIIEVIDPRTSRVVARSSTNSYVTAAFPGRKAAVFYFDADEVPHYAIVALSLERR
jgi:hypothetical protein